MEKLSIPKIRKISIGDNPITDGHKVLVLTVGQTVNLGKDRVNITSIELDESSFYFFGNVRYCVYVQKEDKTIHLWKYFERMPVTIECEI